MTLEDIYNQLEELENNLIFYENRLEKIKNLVMPKATQFDKILVDGGKHSDNILKYIEAEDELKLQSTIDYIKGRMKDLNDLKDKEIKRLSKYGEYVSAVVCLREKEFITEWNGKKRHLTWDEIANRVYCSPRTARYWYKSGTEERKRAK